ncbi:M20 aminoacylase family protein [Salinarimonas soli]|uniref:Amidohydrolase n=1 Tax=Salinarimonas soli TaxID=1638099 RepID=A0A5B2VDV8_9HYPH|nr:M20 aminoacylase family protein [Salinarimonas soli]KAA2237281.1 amidohydrolase [Salinarimonas soli]
MSPLDRIRAYHPELTAIRRDLHAHPEIGFEEERTAGIVAERLEAWGVEVHRGIGGTGVVGVLRGGGNARRIGLRADMDALPIHETTGLAHASTVPGTMHACGHDGHTTMLLGAARYLAETRAFEGTAIFVFQPAEEGLGGARAMLADGLLERFPCDEIYGLHNAPDLPFGAVSVRPGPAMAGADFFDIRLRGRGSHGAYPHRSADPVVAAFALGQALQSIVSRTVDPLAAAVVSVTQVHAGAAYNVIPDGAHLAGTVRTFDDGVRDLTRTRLREIAQGIARAHGVTAEVEIRDIFTVLDNNPAAVDAMRAAARDLFGPDALDPAPAAQMGSEDFADMLRGVPGAYAWIGMGRGAGLHNPAYDFNDEVLPLGAALLARLVEMRSAA